MRYRSFIAVLACLFSWACIDLPEVEQVSETPDAGEPDTPSTDSGTPPDASVPDSGTPALTVTLTTSCAVTNGDVQVSASVSGDSPDEVELLVDGVAVATLAPPYELRWSTQTLEEGSHVLSVRATLGTRGFTSEARTLVVDRTPPRLTAQMPLAGSPAVSVRQAIQATFSEPLEPASVGAESVTLLSDAGVIAAEVVLAPEGTSLSLRPASLLPVDETLRVGLGSLMDLAGNTLQSPSQDWQWTLPGYLPLGDPLSANTAEGAVVRCPSLQVADKGPPVVAWMDGTALTYAGIHVRRWNGHDWEQLGSVIDGAVNGSIFCALEIDRDGWPTVAWDENLGAEGRALHTRRWNGVAWEPVGDPGVLLRQQANADYFVFKGNGQGKLALAFVEIFQGTEQVVVGRWTGSEWSALGSPLKVNASWNIRNLVMEVDAAGNPTVSWLEADSSSSARYMRRWNGSAWDSIPMPALINRYPRDLAIDGSGAPVLDMPAWNGIALSAQLQRWNGSSWAALGDPISTYPGATDSGVAAFALDAQGRLIVLIAEPEVAGQTDVLHVRRWNGGAWESVGSLVRKNPGLVPVGTPLLSMDSSGQPVVARVEKSETEPAGQKVHVYTPNN